MSDFWDRLPSYLADNRDLILSLLGEHIWLSLLPVVLGLLLALPVGYAANRWRWSYPPLVGLAGIMYTIPSLAVFVALPAIIGTSILDPLNVMIALTLYTAALLVRTVADGLAAVPLQTQQAADAMGYSAWRRFWQVDLPVAVPVVFGGLRVATVSNVSLVNVGALIGVGGLGELMMDGYYREFLVPIVVSLVLSVALALLADLLVVVIQRRLTPWDRARRATAVSR